MPAGKVYRSRAARHIQWRAFWRDLGIILWLSVMIGGLLGVFLIVMTIGLSGGD